MHDHAHHNGVRGDKLLWSIILNAIITLAQAVGGLVSGSLSLLSDALHNFSDVLSLIVSYVAHRLSRRKASLTHTFGYKRAEILAATFNAATLIGVAIFLIIEAIERFIDPQRIDSGIVIALSILGIVANGLSVLLLKGDANKNLNMKSAYLHLLTDMMASVAVLIGGALMYWFGWYWIDSLLTLAIAIYLIIVGWALLVESSKMLMLFTPSDINIKEIIREVHKIPGAGKLHHIHVWNLSDEELHLEAHLDCDRDMKLSEFNLLVDAIERVLFEKFKINHINIQPEFSKEDPKDFIVQD